MAKILPNKGPLAWERKFDTKGGINPWVKKVKKPWEKPIKRGIWSPNQLSPPKPRRA